jgi:hypothetical protein
MSAPQVARLQALLSRVQTNRGKQRPSGNGAVAAVAAVAPAAPAAPIAKPSAFEEALPVSIDTMPPPTAFAKPQPQQARPSAEPPRAVRAAIEAEHVRVPDIKPRAPMAQPERAMPAPARPTAPGATPLEMALEGEVMRAADAAAAMPAPAAAPAPAQRPEPRPDPRTDPRAEQLDGGAGRILADPTPPQVSRPIVQATTKHPPAQPNTFAELLKRSLALRPR